jgi:hypothetical protein
MKTWSMAPSHTIVKFGPNWNAALETGEILVGDDVSIKLDVPFLRQAWYDERRLP